MLERRDDAVHDCERGAKLVRGERDEMALQVAEAPCVLLLARSLEEDATDGSDSSQQLELVLRELERPRVPIGDDEPCELPGHAHGNDDQLAHIELRRSLGGERRAGHTPGERGLLSSSCAYQRRPV